MKFRAVCCTRKYVIYKKMVILCLHVVFTFKYVVYPCESPFETNKLVCLISFKSYFCFIFGVIYRSISFLTIKNVHVEVKITLPHAADGVGQLFLFYGETTTDRAVGSLNAFLDRLKLFSHCSHFRCQNYPVKYKKK